MWSFKRIMQLYGIIARPHTPPSALCTWISHLPSLVAARVTRYCNQQALRNISTPESCFYDFAIKICYVYMARKGHGRHLRISPITFEPDVTKASFKYVRVQQDKTYSLIPD